MAWISEKLVWQRLCDDPLAGKLLSVLSGWFIVSALAGWGFANGGPYYWGAFIDYALPTPLVAFVAYRRGMKLRNDAIEEQQII
ncbi:hypothetical protein [Sphingomonas colocasiae]|uniref:Uncharacterized protein n=1 Tax=Sphingomonas colocasiae TaxID=1848973 RepID=A0ABS7PQ13_9SPHN|nr:hypothetical protein [Sphingomonas colocasiae]MBY8822810.1 hypothetical protein [Sphingomonas colocasiae]